jgi:hypothetical protein
MTILEIETLPRQDIISPATEADLVEILMRRLRMDWPTRAIASEVRSHGRCRTDVCVRVRDLHGPKGSDLIVGVEAKLTDWTRALRQALLNRYAVDVSLIAMPMQRISVQVLDIASEHGIGVLGVGARSLSVMSPALVCSPDAVLYERMAAQLKPMKARGCFNVNDLVRGR